MSNLDPAQTLLALLLGEKRQSGRTILVTGPWGCGKTFLWKQTVAPQLRRPHIYISAFGAEGPGNLKGRLLAHFALRLLVRVPFGSDVQEKAAGLVSRLRDKFGRTGQAIASSLNSIGGSFLRRADIDPLELTDFLDASTVICIDDIERVSASFRVEDLLGIVNVLSEHKGFDVVLICNEEQITGNEATAESYGRYKEKAVSTELHVSADPPSMFDRIAQSVVSSEAALKRVHAAKQIILEVFQRSKTENLRVLAKVCTQLEAMCAAGVRELTETEVRFLTAIAIHIAVDPPKDDQFFEFNPFVLRVTSAMDSRSKVEEPRDIARKAFLELYFGDADYEFHSGIHETVRGGRIDPAKFVRAATPELSGPKKTLATVTNGAWRYWNDAQVRGLVQDLVGHIEADEAKTARDLLDCLAYARFLSSIVEEPLPETTTAAAKKALRAIAEAGDESLGIHWEMYMGALMPFVKSEHDEFVATSRSAGMQRLTTSIVSHLKTGAAEEVVRLLTGSDWAPLEAIFEGVGLDEVLALRKTDPHMFTLLVQSLMKDGRTFSLVRPAVGGHVEELVKRLDQVANDQGEEHMARWRAKGLLG